MPWPSWIAEIKKRYLADEASVFLLHGAVRGAHWVVDDASMDCATVLQKFLGRTRPVVGLLTSGQGLSFDGIGDRGTFDRLVAAVELMAQRTTPLSDQDPSQALGRIWLALASTGSDQGYIVADVEQLLPEHRKRIDPLAASAPPLWEWCSHDRIRQSNNILLLLTPRLDAVRKELVAASSVIEVEPPVAVAEVDPAVSPQKDIAVADPDAEAEIEAFLARQSESAGAEDIDDGFDLTDALLATLTAHPVTTWDVRLPVLDAAGRVLAARIPAQIGQITWSVNEEGQAVGTGKGADWLLERWRADIALDAAAGMLLGDIETPEGTEFIEAPSELSATAVKALCRRLDKIVDSIA